jgi:hypothetical protein
LFEKFLKFLGAAIAQWSAQLSENDWLNPPHVPTVKPAIAEFRY